MVSSGWVTRLELGPQNVVVPMRASHPWLSVRAILDPGRCEEPSQCSCRANIAKDPLTDPRC